MGAKMAGTIFDTCVFIVMTVYFMEICVFVSVFRGFEEDVPYSRDVVLLRDQD